jgi:hypothetical protein
MKSPLKSQMFCGAKWAAEYDALFDRLVGGAASAMEPRPKFFNDFSRARVSA